MPPLCPLLLLLLRAHPMAADEAAAAKGASGGRVPPGAPLSGIQHRPQYHLVSQEPFAGWVSDPNGPLYANGRYHMFYQAATTAQMRAHKAPYHTPDPVSWGHM